MMRQFIYFIRVACEPFDISDREVTADEGVECRGREAGEGVLVVDDPPPFKD